MCEQGVDHTFSVRGRSVVDDVNEVVSVRGLRVVNVAELEIVGMGLGEAQPILMGGSEAVAGVEQVVGRWNGDLRAGCCARAQEQQEWCEASHGGGLRSATYL